MAAQAGIDPVRSLLGCSGYSEGWASYVEYQYAYGWALPEEPALAGLSSALDELDLMTAARVDIEVNCTDTSEEEICAMLDDYGYPPESALRLIQAVGEEPAEYLCYALGELEFLRLRQKAEDALGAGFDPLEFHRVVLEGGEMPFPILESRLDDWLAAQQAA